MNQPAAPTDGEIARVVECFGRRAIVQLRNDERWPAVIFGKRLEVVCGDRVQLSWRATSDELQIVAVQPRSSVFTRTDSRGRKETLAANLQLLVAVLAPEPEPDLFMIDRYLAGAAYSGLRSLVLLNKCELSDNKDLLAEYRNAGYQTLAISAAQSLNLDALRDLLSGQTLLLAGQSGVGKSTLTNALLPALRRPTRELSAATGEGKHTTVSAALFDLSNGSSLIDSPGVRDYAPPPIADSQIQVGWAEILVLAPQCRFNDCLHLREPGCAVLAAVTANTIAPRRYESYKRLLNIMRGLLPSYERH